MNADEMFRNLGYEKSLNNRAVLGYTKPYVALTFFKHKKCIDFASKFGMTIEELKAIYKKCEELGWM